MMSCISLAFQDSLCLRVGFSEFISCSFNSYRSINWFHELDIFVIFFRILPLFLSSLLGLLDCLSQRYLRLLHVFFIPFSFSSSDWIISVDLSPD